MKPDIEKWLGWWAPLPQTFRRQINSLVRLLVPPHPNLLKIAGLTALCPKLYVFVGEESNTTSPRNVFIR